MHRQFFVKELCDYPMESSAKAQTMWIPIWFSCGDKHTPRLRSNRLKWSISHPSRWGNIYLCNTVNRTDMHIWHQYSNIYKVHKNIDTALKLINLIKLLFKLRMTMLPSGTTDVERETEDLQNVRLNGWTLRWSWTYKTRLVVTTSWYNWCLY